MVVGGGVSCQYTGGWAVLMEDIVIFMLEKEQYKGAVERKSNTNNKGEDLFTFYTICIS